MAKRTMVDPTTGEEVSKFSWKRLAKSISREMYKRAGQAAELTKLDPQRVKDLMDKVGEWVLSSKFLGSRTLTRKVIRAGRKIKDKLGLA